jgi:hypothetical protein
MDRVYLSKLTVETGAGGLMSYDTNMEGWGGIRALAQKGVDLFGRKIVLMGIWCRDQGASWSYAPSQLAELPAQDGTRCLLQPQR